MAEEVVIVGAGIAGLATALALGRVGMRSLVLERAPELRASGAAISLFPNAWRALDALGVAHKLIPLYPSLRREHVVNISTGVSQEISFPEVTYSCGARGLRCVHRKVLLEALADELPSGTVRFSSNIVSIDTEASDSSVVYVLHLEDGTLIKTKRLIGCDGVHSVIADWLGLAKPIYSGRLAVRGLAVFPEGHGFPNEVRQYVGNGRRAGFVPLDDKEFYWFITYSSNSTENQIKRDPESIIREVTDHLAKDFPADYHKVVNHSDLSTVTLAPLLFRVPWNLTFGSPCKGGVAVAGDAFHPMTPELGQGGCTALEDAVVLARNIANSRDNAAQGIKAYVAERKGRVTSLIARAYLAGWIQQDRPAVWWSAIKFIRDNIFYRFGYSRLMDVIKYDCGALPPMKQ